MTTTFTAPDIECGGCAASIQKALGRMPGVEAVSVDVDTQHISVDFDADSISPHEIAAALDEIGFPVQLK